nr:hypothetical protein GCM10020093_072740 [Planobispora longispora]
MLTRPLTRRGGGGGVITAAPSTPAAVPEKADDTAAPQGSRAATHRTPCVVAPGSAVGAGVATAGVTAWPTAGTGVLRRGTIRGDHRQAYDCIHSASSGVRRVIV